ncbi:hypothetical protein HDU92_005348 [Lobulomyces angularis]|nr:hypothetical protein HDU92_005348 [Lobulomyces angularis]
MDYNFNSSSSANWNDFQYNSSSNNKTLNNTFTKKSIDSEQDHFMSYKSKYHNSIERNSLDCDNLSARYYSASPDPLNYPAEPAAFVPNHSFVEKKLMYMGQSHSFHENSDQEMSPTISENGFIGFKSLAYRGKRNYASANAMNLDNRDTFDHQVAKLNTNSGKNFHNFFSENVNTLTDKLEQNSSLNDSSQHIVPFQNSFERESNFNFQHRQHNFNDLDLDFLKRQEEKYMKHNFANVVDSNQLMMRQKNLVHSPTFSSAPINIAHSDFNSTRFESSIFPSSASAVNSNSNLISFSGLDTRLHNVRLTEYQNFSFNLNHAFSLLNSETIQRLQIKNSSLLQEKNIISSRILLLKIENNISTKVNLEELKEVIEKFFNISKDSFNIKKLKDINFNEFEMEEINDSNKDEKVKKQIFFLSFFNLNDSIFLYKNLNQLELKVNNDEVGREENYFSTAMRLNKGLKFNFKFLYRFEDFNDTILLYLNYYFTERDLELIVKLCSGIGLLRYILKFEQHILIQYCDIRNIEKAYNALKEILFDDGRELDLKFLNRTKMNNLERNADIHGFPSAPPGGSNRQELTIEDVQNILIGKDNRSTFMIRNIPNKYSQNDLLKILKKNEIEFDFFYLRIDFKNKCNVGYAFINFTTQSSILRFIEKIAGKKWSLYNSEKICSLSFAHLQGKEELIKKFKNSSIMLENINFRPKIFLNGVEQPFPKADIIRKKSDHLFTRENALFQRSEQLAAKGAYFTEDTI